MNDAPAPKFKVGDRVVGVRGLNSGRYMTVTEVRWSGRIHLYFMSSGPLLDAEEIQLA